MHPALPAAVAALALAAAAPAADAQLWDLVIEAGMEEGAVPPGGPVAVSGMVVDHAYEPVAGAEVTARAGQASVTVQTGPDGRFRADLGPAAGSAGTYTVNVSASLGGLGGLASTSFEVRGEGARLSPLEQQLTTEAAKRYLTADSGDFEGDPIGAILFEHYRGLLAELVAAKVAELMPDPAQLRADEKRAEAERLRQEAVDEFGPGAGTYSGYQYERHMAGLPQEIRGVVEAQLGFTVGALEAAQAARGAVLEAGGTHAGAHAAYLAALEVPRGELEEFNEQAARPAE